MSSNVHDKGRIVKVEKILVIIKFFNPVPIIGLFLEILEIKRSHIVH